MPYKNFYYPDKNLLYNIFFGQLTPDDVRDHSLEMFKQRKLTEGFIKITDGTLIRSTAPFPHSSVMSTEALKMAKSAVKSQGSVMISDSPLVDAIVDRWIEAGKQFNDEIVMVRSIEEATEFYSVPDMMATLQKIQDEIRLYYANN